jgi:cytochrome c oxidase subunit 3
MPTILNPRDTDRHNRLDENDHGSGRRPPVDKHTGGGGSGDNDNWDHRHQPRSRLMRYRMGIFSALAGDLLFFGGLVAMFLAVRSHGSFDAHGDYIHTWRALPWPRILWLNTAVLLVSSVTMEFARRSMFREIDVMEEWLGLGKPTTNRALPWLIATTLLGFGFLAGQWRAWLWLAGQPAVFRANQSSHFFYIITGIHALHLFLGIAALIGAIIALRASRQIETRQIVVDCVAWYWHSMGLFWIFLFTVLACFQ